MHGIARSAVLLSVLAALSASLSLLLVLFAQESRGCGLTTHIEVAERALFASNETLAQIAREFRGALHAGAVFPDVFFFPCGGPADLSEDLHWTPFLEASVSYIREKYGRDASQWTREAKELVAFLLGVSSHMVADVLWHNLGIDQGFIQSMANVNFHTSYGPAHTVADSLDDSLLLYELSPDVRKQGLIEPWAVPMADIMAILALFKPAQNAVSPQTLVGCISMQYALRVLESLVLAGVFKFDINGIDISFAAVSSHFVTSNFFDFHVGGFSSMAEASTRLWSDVGYMLTGGPGTTGCSMDHNSLFVKCEGNQNNSPFSSPLSRSGVTNIHRRRRCMERYNQLMSTWSSVASLNALASAVIVEGRLVLSAPVKINELLQSGATFDLRANPTLLFSLQPFQHVPSLLPSASSSNAFASAIISRFRFQETTLVAKQVLSRLCLSGRLNTVVTRGDRPYDECGAAAVRSSFDGGRTSDDLAVGCPGGDAVLITMRGARGRKTKVILRGPAPFERFGSALALVDLNKDGFLDLAVGAPLSRNGGTVYVYFGSSKGLGTVASLAFVARFETLPSWSFSTIAGLGHGLASADLDGDGFLDLVVSAPYSNRRFAQSGSVFALFSSQNHPSSGVLRIEEAAGWSADGTMPYSWFGRTMRITEEMDDDDEGKLLLLVAAPYTRKCTLDCSAFAQDDIQSVGAIHGFVFSLPPSTGTTASFVLLGTEQNEKLEAMDAKRIGKDLVLAVGADTRATQPSCRECGRVSLYNLTALLGRGVVRTNQLAAIKTFDGLQSAARFGASLRFVNENLYIVSPLHGAGPLNARQTPLLTRIQRSSSSSNGGEWRRHDTELSMQGRLVDLIPFDAGSKLLALMPRSSLDRFDQGLVLQIVASGVRWQQRTVV